MSTDAAVLELREELNEIAAVEDCGACECLLGVVAQAIADLRRLLGDEARDAEDDLRGLLAAGRDARHSCVQCDPCLPVEPYRRFRRVLAADPAGPIAPEVAVAEGAGEPSAAEAPLGCNGCNGCC